MYGFLGMCLIFVAIALILNGVARFTKMDPKTVPVMNLITGSVLVIGNFILLAKASAPFEFYNSAAGFLFGFTYLIIAANYWFKLDLRMFGWYSLCVAAFATFSAVWCFIGNGYVWMGVLWTAWAALWLEGFIELGLKYEKIANIFPYLSIAEGLFAAGLPAILMLIDKF